MSAVAAAAGVLAVTLSIVSTSFRVPDWQSSISLAEASVKTAPNSARAWGNLANAYKEAGRGPMEVGPPMMKALKLNPNLRIALHLYALRMVELQQFERASEIVDRLRPHAREDHSILNTMGMLSLGQGDFNNAVTYFQEAIEWNSFVPEFRYNLALAYELLGECKQAQKTWTTYFEIERDEGKRANAMARFNRQFELEGSRCFARNQ